MLSASFNYFSTNDCKLDIFLWTDIEAVTSVKSQCKIARNDKESSLYHNALVIVMTLGGGGDPGLTQGNLPF